MQRAKLMRNHLAQRRPSARSSPFHGDAGDRAGRGAEITGDAALLSFRVPGEDDPGPGALRQGPLVFRILFGDRAAEEMPEHDGKGSREPGHGPAA